MGTNISEGRVGDLFGDARLSAETTGWNAVAMYLQRVQDGFDEEKQITIPYSMRGRVTLILADTHEEHFRNLRGIDDDRMGRRRKRRRQEK